MRPQDNYEDLGPYAMQGSGYRSDRRRGLSGWIILATIVSVILHALLFYSFKVMKVQQVFVKDSLTEEERRERIHIDPDLLKEQMAVADIPTADEPPAPDLSAIDEKLDLLEVQEQLPEKEVILTPDVAEAENYIAELGNPIEASPAVSLIDALEGAGGIDTGAALENDIARIKKRIAERGAVSENQLMLDASDLEDVPGLDDGDLLGKIGEGADSSDPIDGFSSLDGLLARSGKLPRNLDPVLLPTDLVFGYNEEQVKESARLSLMKLGMLIQKNPDSIFIIEGHTDGFGGDTFNQALSERRAQAVKSWLMESLRLPGDNVQTRGHGSSKPLVDHSKSIEEQGINRRVEIVIRPKD